jgi:putative nucleotidyltransferase with HDIG domain
MVLTTKIRFNPLVAYIAALAVGVIALTGAFVAAGYGLGDRWTIAGLAVIAAFAERRRVRVARDLEESISLLPVLFALVLFGPIAGMIVGAASMLGQFRPPFMKWAVYSCSRAITGGVAGIAASAIGGLASSRLGSIALAATVGALVAQSLDVTFGAITVSLRGLSSVRQVVRTVAPLVAASVPLFAPVVGLLALAYRELTPWTLPLFFVPALAAQSLFVLYQEQRRLTEDLVGVNAQLERANLSFATALVATLDARDRYTAGHSAAVAIYARDIAKRMGLSDQQVQLSHLCGLVHDIGKIGLPAGLLEKPGPLTLEERRQMEAHSAIGERILAKVDDYAEIAGIVRHHHERWDGEGYPDRRSAEDIPLLSRIIAAADAYNAMTSDRPYRDAMPSRVARLRLAQAVESQFDTSVVAAFEAILAGASDAYRSAAGSEFNLESQDVYSDAPTSAEAA